MPKLPDEPPATPKPRGCCRCSIANGKIRRSLKQLRVLAAHMQKEGIVIQDQKAVQACIENIRVRITSGELVEVPDVGANQETVVKSGPDVGRNDPCLCGSGQKFKKCCAGKQ